MYIYVPIAYTDIPYLYIKFLEQETDENIAGISKYEYSRFKKEKDKRAVWLDEI